MYQQPSTTMPRRNLYVVNDGKRDISFSRSEYVAGRSTAAYTFYLDAATATTLKLLKPQLLPTDDRTDLRRLSQNEVAKLSNRQSSSTTIMWCLDRRLPSASVSRSRSASYNLVIDGTYRLNSAPTNGKTYGLSGNGGLTTDFASATTGITPSPVATNTANGSMIQFGTLTGAVSSTQAPRAERDQPNARGRRKQDAVQRHGNFYGPQRRRSAQRSRSRRPSARRPWRWCRRDCRQEELKRPRLNPILRKSPDRGDLPKPLAKL